jgi:hypothetical protein
MRDLEAFSGSVIGSLDWMAFYIEAFLLWIATDLRILHPKHRTASMQEDKTLKQKVKSGENEDA